ncbi:MAG: sulfurtransferase [Herpetosiphonaceae bacterium]|nr:MAG: sulfurtransferase [Herpetosiphonaceae bacterium]
MTIRDSITLPPVVDGETLAGLLEKGTLVKVIDVRSPAEFETAHIPGSYNVPLDLLPEHGAELRDVLGAPVILVCRSGARARQAEQVLREVELSQVHILEGGISAWEAAGKPLRRGRSRWSLERQVRGVAGALVLLGMLGGLLLWRPLFALSALVGAGLSFSALTDSCLMAKLLSKLPYNRGSSCDIELVLQSLRADGLTRT